MKNQKLFTFINKLRTSKDFVTKATVVFLRNNTNSNIIAEYNKQQMLKGKDSKGEQLGDYSELRTAQRMLAGKQVGYIDLNFTGQFYDSIYIDSGVVGNSPVLTVNSDDPKLDDIMDDDRFKDALGLDQTDRDKVGMMIATHLQKELLKYYSV